MNETKKDLDHEQPVVREVRPDSTVRHVPLKPHEYTEPITPNSDVFVLAHVGIPRAFPEDWWLDISGLVERPQRLSLAEIKARPKRQITSLHQCAGFPMNPRVATRRYANVVWGGVDLAVLLQEIGIKSNASYLWSFGCDRGRFAEITSDVYCKDMPLERLQQGDILLAYEINGEPLSHEHGSPLRLIIPGYFGTNAVKWLYRLEIQDRRPSSPYTTTYYNDVLPDGSTRPVWELAPESIIVSPADHQSLSKTEQEIWGWAWSHTDIVQVDVSMDGGESWQPAMLDQSDRWSWRRFSFRWTPPEAGSYVLMSRATDRKGEAQPMSDRRNCVYQLTVLVT